MNALECSRGEQKKISIQISNLHFAFIDESNNYGFRHQY